MSHKKSRCEGTFQVLYTMILMMTIFVLGPITTFYLGARKMFVELTTLIWPRSMVNRINRFDGEDNVGILTWPL